MASDPASTITYKASSVTLPLTFSNSFWSHDYKSGVNSVYSQLQHGIVASQELVDAVLARAQAERAFAQMLIPSALKQDGFAADEGASLRVGYEAILTSVVGESRARTQLADDLERSIAHPFQTWSQAHAGRVASSRALVDQKLSAWEAQYAKTIKLKTAYDEACRQADQAEDEVRFEGGHAHQVETATGAKDDQGDDGDHEDDVKSEDGHPFSPQAEKDEDDDALLPRSGAPRSRARSTSGSTPGSAIASALGRAFTVRRGRVAAHAAGQAAAEGKDAAHEHSVGTAANEQAAVAGVNSVAALDWSKTTFNSLLERVAGPQTGEGRIERTRKAADEVEGKYKAAVVSLDSLRLTLEETLSDHLPYLQRCETDRLRAASSVLRSFHVALAALPRLLSTSHDRVTTAVELMRPEVDVRALVERGRTGAFAPHVVGFASHYADDEAAATAELDGRGVEAERMWAFGVDLRRWDEGRVVRAKASTGSNDANADADAIPAVLKLMLEHVERRYAQGTGSADVATHDKGKRKEASDSVPTLTASKPISNAEKRKAWLYETPLSAQHHLRSALNARWLDPKDDKTWEEAHRVLAAYDLPIVASTIKLWLLELEIPPIVFTQYDELKHLYRRVGAETVPVPPKALADHLSRLPHSHLRVVKAMITHFAKMMKGTSAQQQESNVRAAHDDEDDVYLQKLALSTARCFLRPKVDTSMTLDDRFPALLVADLVRACDEVFEAADQLRVGRDDRYKPRRQRTKPFDTRITRQGAGLNVTDSVDRQKAAALLLERQRTGVASGQQAATSTTLPALQVPATSAIGDGGYSASPVSVHAHVGDSPPPVPLPVPLSVSFPDRQDQTDQSPVSQPPSLPRQTVRPQPPQPPSLPRPKSPTHTQAQAPFDPSPAPDIQSRAPLKHDSRTAPTESAFVPPSPLSSPPATAPRGPSEATSEETETPEQYGATRAASSTSSDGSISRTTRVRGARGPRPISVNSASATTAGDANEAIAGTGAGVGAAGNRVARIRDSFQQQQQP